jgi:hypothetical protein
VDCQSYVAFVIEVVGTLGLSIGPNITWNEITPDEPITRGSCGSWWLPAYCSGMLDGTRYRDNSPTL